MADVASSLPRLDARRVYALPVRTPCARDVALRLIRSTDLSLLRYTEYISRGNVNILKDNSVNRCERKRNLNERISKFGVSSRVRLRSPRDYLRI